MRDVAGLLGWIVVCGFIFELLNFILKFINKKYIVKLPKDKKLVLNYRRIMKLSIKFHKPVGILISLVIICHFILMLIFAKVSVTGLISLFLMLSIFTLGIYGAYINKSIKGNWVKIHRIFAFLLIIFIFIHVVL